MKKGYTPPLVEERVATWQRELHVAALGSYHGGPTGHQSESGAFALGAALSALSVLFVSACGGNDVTDSDIAAISVRMPRHPT